MRFSLSLLALIFVIGCTPTKEITKPTTPEVVEKQTLAQSISENAVFSKSFTGFALYDPSSDEMLESITADKYFTPASNTKIFTCFASMSILGDSIPALKYIVTGDSLIFWGTGDPSLLYAELDKNDRVVEFLKSRKEKLFFAPQWVGDRFGPGWAWDDYNDYYSTERSSFPIYGNVATIKMRSGIKKPAVVPTYFQNNLKENSNYGSRTIVKRNEHENVFVYNNPNLKYYTKDVPFRVSNELVKALLEEAIGKPLTSYWQVTKIRKRSDVKTLYSMKTDDMLRVMMQNSDNFLAEQLLMLCSYEKFNYFSDREIISYVKDSLLADSPDKLIWRDGSGLSRYNLFTPQSMVYTLNQIREQFGDDRIQYIFAEGGVSGTIKKWYGGQPSYIYAKTGTLSNKHCLSGYLLTKSGKTLIFSFMHNNYITGSSPLKREMQTVLENIRDNY